MHIAQEVTARTSYHVGLSIFAQTLIKQSSRKTAQCTHMRPYNFFSIIGCVYMVRNCFAVALCKACLISSRLDSIYESFEMKSNYKAMSGDVCKYPVR